MIAIESPSSVENEAYIKIEVIVVILNPYTFGKKNFMTINSIQLRAQSLHRQAIVIDGHSDILSAVADERIRLRDRVKVDSPEAWQGEKFVRMPPNTTPYEPSAYSVWYECMGQYDIPRWREGGVTAQVTAIYVDAVNMNRPLERAMEMVAAFHQEIEANPDTLLLATGADDIRRAKAEDKTALMLSFEGAEPLGHNLKMLDIFYRLGLRMISLTHSRRNAFADGTQLNVQTGGLTYLGRMLIEHINKKGILLDLAHLNDVGVWEVLQLTTAPLIYSHTTVAGMKGYKSELTEIDPYYGTSKLKLLAEKGGVAGVIFVEQPNVSAIVDDIEAIIDHVGDDHVSLGSDFVSLSHAPKGLEDVSRLPVVTEEMVRRGLSNETIMKVLGGNLLRVFETVIG